MSKAKSQVINGITYPREVPLPEGMPVGWKGIEQAYGANSKAQGTYIRFLSLDGKHRGICSPKQAIQLHCQDEGIPWEPEFNKYEQAFQDRKDREAAERAMANEEKGVLSGDRREEMIALSQATWGEISGPIVFGFPGWKCRFDYLPESQQCPKTLIAPDGREWKILKDLECYFGTRIAKGSEEVAEITRWIEIGKVNYAAHQLFSTGSRKARECAGSCLLDHAAGAVVLETAEERAARVPSSRKKTEDAGKDYLDGFSPAVLQFQTGWAALASTEDREKGFVEFKDSLLKRKYSEEEVRLVAVHGVAEACSFATRISGIYHQMAETLYDRPCYQKLLHVPNVRAGIACDGVYIMWSDDQSRWQISSEPTEEAPCIAYCKDDRAHVTEVLVPWQVQRTGNSDFQEDGSLKVTAAQS